MTGAREAILASIRAANGTAHRAGGVAGQEYAAADILPREIGNRAFFLALEMQAVGVNLSEMNFHS